MTEQTSVTTQTPKPPEKKSGVKFVEPEADDTTLGKDVPEPSEAEESADAETEKAQASGWKPKDQWKGDPDKWVDAAEYNKRGELFEAIKATKKELAEQRRAFLQLQEHNRRLADALRNQRIGELEAQKEQAVESADSKTVKQIDKAIDEVKGWGKEESSQGDQTVQQWQQANPWFANDPALHYEAIALHQEQVDSGLMKVKPLSELLDEVAGEIRKRHPNKFGVKPNGKADEPHEEPRPKRQAVEAPSQRVSGGKKKFGFSDLNEYQQKACRTFVRKGVFKSDAEYIQQLADLGELK